MDVNWVLPRKANITLYIAGGIEKQDSLLKKLSKYSTGKGRRYIKKVKDVDTKVLKKILSESVNNL